MIEGINRIEETYRKLIASGRSVLKLFSGNPSENGLRFPPEILQGIYSRYFKSQDYQPHPKGLPAAREAISRYYQGAVVDPENIILTSGTSESYLYLFSLLGRPGDNFLTPCPSYPLFDPIAKLTRVDLRHYSLAEDNGWAVDMKDLREKTDSRTKGIILVSPNNPTGAVVSAEQIREIVDWANRKEIPLICDEVFAEFYFGSGSFPRPMQVSRPKLCFTLNGISKMFALPGLKLSWIAVTGEKAVVDSAVDRLETTADTFLSCHIPIQEALPLIFSEGEGFLRSYREEVGRRRRLAIDLLKQSPSIRFVEPVGGFYLMASVGAQLIAPLHSEEEFVIRLMKEKGVFVHPGYFYDYEKGVHIVISCLTEGKRLEKGLVSLLSFLGGRD